MEAYAYHAALYCKQCAKVIQVDLTPDTDSDKYPQGPDHDGGGEADCPNHCGRCGTFLQNPLTTDGIEYVREQMRKANPIHPSPALLMWAAYYGQELCECDKGLPEDAEQCVPCYYIGRATN